LERYSRICLLHRLLLNSRRPVPRKTIEASLECSRATVARIMDELRNLTRDPIPYDRALNGYHYENPNHHVQDLPFLFFSAPELNALLVINHYLETLHTGFLSDALAPLRGQVQNMLAHNGESAREVERRIKILPSANRFGPGQWFSRCAEAVLQRKRLRIDYHARGADQRERREISPQRLIHYRDNWYLDAWCHQREALRCFAVERVLAAELLPQSAKDIDDPVLEAHFASGYGIFAGPARAIAHLRFSPDSARWVADEQWHPQQQGTHLHDGGYELRIPYSNPTELIMDILKHGPHVEVLEPQELRDAVVERLRKAVARYR
jgi:proteasome accessory factor C